MSKPKKSTDERLKELEQKINRMKIEQKRLQQKKKSEARKQRDHAMILIGATLMTHYPNKVEELINSDDETIQKWVHSLFQK